jgi:hypothetical protein
MTATSQSLQSKLSRIAPFDQLPGSAFSGVLQGSELLRYRIGQPIVRPEALPQLVLILEGQARLLGEDPRTEKPLTLGLLEHGALLGVVGLLRGTPCETAIASSEVVGLKFSIASFQTALDEHPAFANAVRNQLYLAEVFDLLARQVDDLAQDVGDLAQLAQLAHESGCVEYLPYGKQSFRGDRPEPVNWYVSSGTIINQPMGSRLNLEWAGEELEIISPQGARLVGLPDLPNLPVVQPPAPNGALAPIADDTREAIPYAPDHLPEPEPDASAGTQSYPFVRGRGEVEGMLACMEMVSQFFGMPFRRDIIRRILTNQRDRLGQLSLPLAGKVAEFMGLRTQMTKVPASAVSRLPTPALIAWQEGYAVLYETNAKVRVLAVPETGIIQRSPLEFEEIWGSEGEILLLEKTRETPQERFGLSWFIPSLKKVPLGFG